MFEYRQHSFIVYQTFWTYHYDQIIIIIIIFIIIISSVITPITFIIIFISSYYCHYYRCQVSIFPWILSLATAASPV